MSNVVKITNSPGSNNSFFVPVGYVVNARRIADRRVILAGYGLADLLMRIVGNSGTAITAAKSNGSVISKKSLLVNSQARPLIFASNK